MKKSSGGLNSVFVKRKEKLEESVSIKNELMGILAIVNDEIKKYELLKSVCTGLYDELDKLCRKAPAENVTDLVLDAVNDVIEEVKNLIKNDGFIQRINKFIAAGDNPQHRDVVLVLRQVMQGLDRFKVWVDSRKNKINGSLLELGILEEALTMSVRDEEAIVEIEYLRSRYSIPEDWVYGYPKKFNFSILDEIDLKDYVTGLSDE